MKFKLPLFCLALVVYTVPAVGQKLEGQNLPEVFCTEQGAIGGYDPVAFFTEKKPVSGNDSIAYQWNDATWHFASLENRETFKANPEKYAPQFGGYCVYGTASGHKS